jgi:hypothetical protein
MTMPGPAEPLPPYVPPAGPDAPRRGNGVGLAALIVGIVAIVLAFIPFVSFVAFLPALAAIALGIVGLVLQGRSRGTSVAGLILGGVALIAAIAISIVSVIGLVGRTAAGVDELRSAFPTDVPSDPEVTASPPLAPTGSPSPGLTLAPGDHTVVYTITGTGTATVNYGTFAGGDSSSSSGKKLPLPFRKTVTVHTTADSSFASFTVGATQLDPKEPVGCSISVDGKPVSSKRSDSTTLAFVFCTARTSF